MVQEELASLMEKHKKWVETAGKHGRQMALDSMDLSQFDLSEFSFEQIYLSECHLNTASLVKKDFFRSEFYSCHFSGGQFEDCDFRKAVFDYCDFRGARFIRCQFSHTEIFQSCFADCFFEDCSFVGIDLMESDLNNTTFIGIDWDGAYMDQVILFGAKGEKSKNIQSVVRAKISINQTPDTWIENTEAIDWLQSNMNNPMSDNPTGKS